LGGGGALVTSDQQLAELLHEEWQTLAKASPAASGVAWLRQGIFALAFQPPLWWLATRLGAQRVGEHEGSWGYALTSLTPAQAAVGRALLPRLDAINRARRERARQLLAGLAEFSALTTPAIARTGGNQGMITERARQPVYLRLPLLTSTPAQADTIFAVLTAAGIGVGRMYGRTLADFFPQVASAPLPASAQVARTLLTLPTNHHLGQAEIERIPALIRTALTAL
jgi:dTDP-4-amino-4,6-dideoxygalactose transaminase